MKKFDTQKGISLIETIIYIAIFAVFIIGVTSFINNMTISQLRNQIILEVNDQGNQAINLITQTLRNAETITSPLIGSTDSSLALTVPLGGSVVFSLSDGVLYINENGGGDVALTNNKVIVSDLIFSNLSQGSEPNSIQIRFKVNNSDSRPESNYSANFYGTATLRKP